MKLTDRVIAITGAGDGIGAAMARRFALAGVRGVIVSDKDGAAAADVAESIVAAGGDALACTTDAGSRDDIRDLVRLANKTYGSIDVFCSNAGATSGSGVRAVEQQWTQCWSVNVMQHVYAAQAALPGMLRNKDGYLLITSSAAGLLSLPGDAPYSVTKQAAIGFAEWLAITYRERGIKVSALCPYGVKTSMVLPGIESNHPAAMAIAAAAPLLEPDQVAEKVVSGIEAERFLILPHPEVATAYADKAADPDAWIERTVSESNQHGNHKDTALATGERG